MKRNRILILTLAVAGLGFGVLSPAPALAECGAWRAFKDRFVAETGRVVDTGNARISHSEGQGYGLLLAEAHDDAAAFARIFQWTHSHLMVRDDGLLVWKWSPQDNAHYPDTNSAADGDLLVAYALLRAGERFQNPHYTRLGERLADAIREHLVREVGGYTVLLPGPTGFRRDDGSAVINLSYWVFPALEGLSRLPGGALWERLAEDGRSLLKKARFSRWNLPPDWAVLQPSGRLTLTDPEAFEPVFGYNAVRIPLHLLWAKAPADPDLLRPYRQLWGDRPTSAELALEVDLRRGEVVATGPNSGYAAVHRLLTRGSGGDGSGQTSEPSKAGTDYYAAALSLLACLAEDGASPCDCP